MDINKERPQWASHTSFIFAASAAAIGLGNIWRFPYVAGQNGGGAFVITYLLCVLLLGIPLLIAEIVIGRAGKQNPAGCFKTLALKSHRSSFWGWLGFINLLAAFLILTYYTVICGWVVNYSFSAMYGQFHHITEPSSLHTFKTLQSHFGQMLLTTTLVIVCSMGINILGIKGGLERAVMVIFPVLLLLMGLLLAYAIMKGNFSQALHFLFHPNIKQFTGKTILLALGQAFFSLNIAMGVTVMFSAYLPNKISSVTAAIGVACADTGFALLSGLIIFPIVFAYHLKVAAGPSLIFQTLPIAFGQMPFGNIIATLFFVMLFFAAFSSVISLFEPSICWLMEKCNINRKISVVICGTVCWLLSFGTITSFTHPHWHHATGSNYFHIIDFLTANIMLPVGGLFIALFCGWWLDKNIIKQNLHWDVNSLWYQSWQFILRYFAPAAIFLILLASLKVL
ncbi:MAG: sodium-dependent transporter [Gammaproteobacteria bacterium]|nr:sodium-dependent transporter [Gammaproteobacteria bacterium]MCH9744599.1 sodium-dependent transporter [Gammaproteobacteria bacterium]